MREILFRGKRKDNGGWVQGHNVFYMQDNDNVFITQAGLPVPTLGDGNSVVVMMHPSTEVWIDTVCQFTGLTDKNGKKIFEGDIIKWDAEEWGAEYCEPVVWDYSFLGVRQNDWQHFCEVIGNIHDNPELLEG